MSSIAYAAPSSHRERCPAPLQWQTDARVEHRDLPATLFAGLQVLHKIGEGCRCVVFAAKAGEDTDLVLKIYRSAAIDKHVRRCRTPLARYEYERNAAFQAVRELRPFVATPVAYFSSQYAQAMLQERVVGEPLTSYLRTASTLQRSAVCQQIRRIVQLAHGSGLFDLDLQPHNILVRRSADGTPRPVLFDFNKIPYHIRPPNAVFALLLQMRLLAPESRDRRYCKLLSRLCGHASSLNA